VIRFPQAPFLPETFFSGEIRQGADVLETTEAKVVAHH